MGDYELIGEICEINEFIKFFLEDCFVIIFEVVYFVKLLGGDFFDVFLDGDLDKVIVQMKEDGEYVIKWFDKNCGEMWDCFIGKKEGKFFGGGKFKLGGGFFEKKKLLLFDD